MGPLRAALLVAAATGALARPAAALEVLALGVGAASNQMVRFDSATPGTVEGPTPVTGLAAGDTLVGIDTRPATGELVGLAVNGNLATLYRISPVSFAASPIGSATVSSILGATSYGVDINPTIDIVRVVNNLASDGAGGNVNNFRLRPTDGTLVAIDPDLDFTGLPGGNASAPVVGAAHTDNLAGAATTTPLGIASGGDRLVLHGGAGLSTLANVGLLGVDTTNNAALDIVGPDDDAFAILEVGGVSGFYTVNLATGAAILVGTIGTGTVDFGGMTLASAAPLVETAGLVCGPSPSAAASAAESSLVTPDAPGSSDDCPAVCKKWSSACKGLVGAARGCWKKAGARIASVRSADCNTHSDRAERAACQAALGDEKRALAEFLAADAGVGEASCAGAGLEQCLLGCAP